MTESRPSYRVKTDFRLPVRLVERLDRLAESFGPGATRTDVVIKALERGLDRLEREEERRKM